MKNKKTLIIVAVAVVLFILWGVNIFNGLVSKEESVDAGALGIGWYRLEFLNSQDQTVAWSTTAVLAKQHVTVSQTSPVCIDSATAWFARDDITNQDNLAQMASLAQVNWVRDRIKWREMEPTQGVLKENTTYDIAADVHATH